MLPVGWGAALVEVGDADAARAAYERLARLRAAGRLPGVVELVPAARTVLVEGDPLPDLAALLSAPDDTAAPGDTAHPGADVDAAAGGPGGGGGGEAAGGRPGAGVAGRAVVRIAVRYDGPDLDEVGRLTGLGADEVARRHAAADYVVAFCGFAPGFGYLTGLPDELRVPRRRSPRTAVPAGSVGIAGEFAGVYPRRSPGGWQLLGRTEAVLWDAERDPPALLAPGTRVRFGPA